MKTYWLRNTILATAFLSTFAPTFLQAQSNGGKKDPRTPPVGVVNLGSRGGGVEELGDSLNGALEKKERQNKRISLTQKRLGEKPINRHRRKKEIDPPSPASDRAREQLHEEIQQERSAAGSRD